MHSSSKTKLFVFANNKQRKVPHHLICMQFFWKLSNTNTGYRFTCKHSKFHKHTPKDICKPLLFRHYAVCLPAEMTVIIIITIAKHVFSYYNTVSYTHLRAHETVLDIVCRLLLE